MATHKRNQRENESIPSASRRRFLRNFGLVLASVGISPDDRLQILDEVSRQLLPAANADTLLPKRMIFVGVRSGVPIIGMGTHAMFSQLNAPVVPNCPFAGNQLIKTGVNGLYLTPASAILQKHAENIAFTQGVRTEGGHTGLFNFWEGGSGAAKLSPIIELKNRNTTGSLIPGVHFELTQLSRLVSHQINGQSDMLYVHESNFTNNFRKPNLLLRENEVNRIMASAVKLSRRQALRTEAILNNPIEVANRHDRAAKIMNLDYRNILDITQMDSVFESGSGPYRIFGRSLAYTLKAMSLNLINSSCLEIDVGDWHGLRDSQLTVPYYQQMSAKLAATIDYLKSTPEPADLSKTLWDSTLIVLGSEFTRVDRTFNEDNGDGGGQGIMLIGKNVSGGYYGEIRHSPSSLASDQILTFSGFDRRSGQSMPLGQLNTTSEIYHTINSLVGNTAVDAQQVWSAVIKG